MTTPRIDVIGQNGNDGLHYSDTINCTCGHAFPAELGKYGCPNCEGETPVDAKDYRLTRDLRELTEYLRESVSEQDALLVEEAIDRIRHLNETNRALQGNQPEVPESSSCKPAVYNSDQEAAQ